MATNLNLTAQQYDAYGNPIKKANAPLDYAPGASAQPQTQSTQSGQNAQLSQLDTLSPNNSVQLSQAAMSGAAAQPAQDMNQHVLEKAQSSYLGAPGQSDLQKAYTQQAQKYVSNPMGDFDPAKNKQQQLEKSNQDWANSFESMRQQFGNVSGSGLLQKDMLSNALQHNVDQASLEGQIDQQNYARYADAMGKSLAEGRATEQQNQNVFSQGLQNAATVRGMAEGQRSQNTAFSQEMTKIEKTFGQDMAKLVSSQNWQGAQSALDRDLQLAMKNKDIAQQDSLFERQKALDLEKLQKTQDWQGTQNEIQQKTQMAMQSNDIMAVRANLERQLEVDKWKTEQGIKSTAEQNAINNELQKYLQGQKIASDNMNANAQRELDALLTSKQITQQERQLAQQATQFDNELDYKRWAQQQNVDQLTADRAWKASESVLDRAQQKEVQANEIQNSKDLVDLKTKADKGLMLQQQDFEGAQKSLDREAQVALQKGEWDKAVDLMNRKATIDAAASEADKQWQSAERQASQYWQTGERQSAEGFQQTMKYLDSEIYNANAAQDLLRAKDMESLKYQNQINQMLKGYDLDAQKMWMQSALDEARAEKDWVRQEAIISFQTNSDIYKMTEAGKIDEAKMRLQTDLQESLAGNDFVRTMTLQKSDQLFKANQASKDRMLEQARIDLQGKQITLQGKSMAIDAILAGVENGSIDGQAAVDAISGAAKTYGVEASIKPVDPMAQTNAINNQFNNLQISFAMTHPEFAIKDDGGKVIGINDSGKAAFSQYYNDTIYGTKTDDYLSGKLSYTGLIGKTGSQEYKNLFDAAHNPVGTGTANKFDLAFSKLPVNSYFKIGNDLFAKTGDVGANGDKQFITAVNVATGKPTTILSSDVFNGGIKQIVAKDNSAKDPVSVAVRNATPSFNSNTIKTTTTAPKIQIPIPVTKPK